MVVSSLTFFANLQPISMRSYIKPILLVVLVAGCSIGPEAASNPDADIRTLAVPKVINLSAADLANEDSLQSLRFIDVREKEEIVSGIIVGAENIPLKEFDPKNFDLSDNREVVFYCRSGRRSKIAAERLANHTGYPVKHLDGGFLSWVEANLETEVP